MAENAKPSRDEDKYGLTQEEADRSQAYGFVAAALRRSGAKHIDIDGTLKDPVISFRLGGIDWNVKIEAMELLEEEDGSEETE